MDVNTRPNPNLGIFLSALGAADAHRRDILGPTGESFFGKKSKAYCGLMAACALRELPSIKGTIGEFEKAMQDVRQG